VSLGRLVKAIGSDRPQEDDAARRNTRMRFEQWAHNPSCQANTVSAVHNIRMADVAESEGFEPTFGQSPFALARGETFERQLFYNEAKILIESLVEKGVLPEDSSGLIDLRIAMNGGPLPDLDVAINRTTQLLQRMAQTATQSLESLPAIIAGATLRIPRGVMLPEAVLILDVLAVRSDEALPKLTVGEVKTYPDKGGHTNSSDLALARAQAGLYLHALQLATRALSLHDKLDLDTNGFLVLTRPGSNRPSVRAGEDLRFQAERARRGFELLEKAALGLPPFKPLNGDPVKAVIEADTDYCEACLSFCDRVEKCHADALAEGNPAILGEDTRRFLGSMNLDRAMELMDGQEPRNEMESDFVRRVAETDWIVRRNDRS